jgi:hypothetical protein
MTRLQELLIKKISSTKDEQLLQEVSRLLEAGFTDEVYTLTKEQKAAVEEARQQIKEGQFLSNDDANKQAKEWLKKK